MYKMYKKKTLTEATPWTPEFDMTLVSVSEADKLSGSPKVGDMIARNPNNPDDLWLIEANTFAETYEPVVEDTTTPVVVDAQVEAVNITPAVIVENTVSNAEGTDAEEYTIGGQLTVYEIDEDVASYVVDRAKVSEMLEDIKMVSLPVDARVEIMNGMTEVHGLIADSLVNADTNSIEITKDIFRERVILHTIPVINGVLIKNELPKVSLLIDSEKSEKLFILDEEENVLNLVLSIDYAGKTFSLSSPDWDFISMLRGKVELISTEVVEAVLPVTSDAKEAIATADKVTA